MNLEEIKKIIEDNLDDSTKLVLAEKLFIEYLAKMEIEHPDEYRQLIIKTNNIK